MLRFLIKRLALTIPTFVALMFVTFMLLRLVPGDPIEVRRGERGISPERLAELRHEMGLDQSIVKQFLDYAWSILHGDFGTSIISKTPITHEFFTLFPATLELSICAGLFAILLGIPAGVIAAVQRGKFFDQALMTTALTGYSMPIFWWGLVLILLFSNTLHLTPVSGRVDLVKFYYPQHTGLLLVDSLIWGPPGAFKDVVKHLILPTIVLGTLPLAVIARMTRSSMLEVLEEDYVRTARAKGLSPLRVVGVHALRNAFIPVVTAIGLQVGSLLAGAVQTETIFSWPGVGHWLINSIARRDYPALQGGIMLIAVMVIVVNLLLDLTSGLLNPRVRNER
jgi:dipeptide transport system permease protein